MTLQIITNHHEKEIVYWQELTDKEREWFDWDGVEEETYFRYKGEVYCLGEFMVIQNHPDKDFSSWDGYRSDTFFSGILVKYSEDTDFIIAGWYMS